MDWPNKGLNIPLHKRNWLPLWTALGSIFVGWLYHRPTTLGPIFVSCIVGGAAVWILFASPIVIRFGTHQNILVRVLTLLFAIVGLVVFMRNVITYLHGVVS